MDFKNVNKKHPVISMLSSAGICAYCIKTVENGAPYQTYQTSRGVSCQHMQYCDISVIFRLPFLKGILRIKIIMVISESTQ